MWLRSWVFNVWLKGHRVQRVVKVMGVQRVPIILLKQSCLFLVVFVSVLLCFVCFLFVGLFHKSV